MGHLLYARRYAGDAKVNDKVTVLEELVFREGYST